MKRIFLLAAIVVMLTGCKSVKWYERHCEDFAKICVVERVTETEYRDTTIYMDRVIEISLPTDSVTIHDTLTIIDNAAYLPPVMKTFDNIGVRAWVRNSVLEVRGFYLDSLLMVPVRDTVYLEKVIKETTTAETIKVKYTPMFYRIAVWVLAVLFFLTAIICVALLRSM